MGNKCRKSSVKTVILSIHLLFVAIFIIVLLILFVVENRTIDIKKHEYLNYENRIIEFEQHFLCEEYDGIISDLLYLVDSFKEYKEYGLSDDDIAKNWVIFSNQLKSYDQIKYLDYSGEEIIRIDYDEDGAHIVDKENLQNKDQRYYFQETIKLNENQIYISKLDLNIENDVIEDPIKPMLRFSMPIYKDDQLEGVIIINYAAKPLLERFRINAHSSRGEIMLLNSSGYWLSSQDPSLEWTFMYEDKKDISFESYYPDEWDEMDEKSGYINSENGFIIYAEVFIDDRISTIDGTLCDNEIILGDGNWKIVSIIKDDNPDRYIFNNNKFEIIKRIIGEKYILFIVLYLISIALAICIKTSSDSQREKKYFSEYDIMTDTLNRRAGIQKLEKHIISELKKNNNMSICFIDINGLKEVNDIFGHNSGDELIKTTITGIKRCIRENDFIIRLGGDEFIIVFMNIGVRLAENIWEKIKLYYDNVNNTENRPYIVSASHGIAECNNKTFRGLDELIRVADEKMYTEKKRIRKNIKIIRKKKQS